MKNLKVNNEINEHLQPIKTDEVSSSLEVSKSKVKTQHLQVDGDLTVNGYIDGALRAESELNLESNGTINLTSSTSSVSNDITLNTGGRDLTIQNDTEKIIAFSNGGGIVPTLLLYAWNGNTDDYLTIYAAGNNGEMTIQTIDAAGESADLKIDADGDITLESESDIIKITCSGTEQARFTATGLNIAQGQKIALDGTTTEDYIYGDGTDVFIALGDSDITTFKETETLSEVPVKVRESANAVADTAAYGQLWVKNDTPNCLAFTDDAGTDIIGIGKYQYDIRVSNYFASAAGNYIPLAGYVIERTTTAGQNEFIGLLAPFNGTLESLHFRSEIAQNGNFRIIIYEASDGTEVPGTPTGQWDSTQNEADDTTMVFDFNTLSASSGNNVITKGRLYIIKVTSPSTSYDTNVTTVWKWDITS
tara:strand:+ start:1910 stop:3169 length:1260 start_codon:yes stop_codon:yes gene_type:complete